MSSITDIDRWRTLIRERRITKEKLWAKRLEIVSGFIEPNSTVADLGVGECTLRSLLPVGCTYDGYDCVPMDDEVTEIDFNKDMLPNRVYDCTCCVGILEYIADLQGFLLQLHRFARMVIATYHIVDTKNATAMGWMHGYSEADFLTMIDRAGFDMRRCIYNIAHDTQHLFVLDNRQIL